MTTALATVLIGEGAYEGLSAIWEELAHDDVGTIDVRGIVVIDGDLAP